MMSNPRSIDGLIYNNEEEVPTLLNPVTGQIFVTNEVGRRVLELCDGDRTIDEVIAAILNEFADSSADQVREDVQEFLTRAIEQRLTV